MENTKTPESTYIPTIGIECHVQLKTKTKLFAAVGNDARQAEPNTLISHICVGLPGALPVLNEAAIELASRAAFALGTRPQKFSQFDRKHYFYPDLPKGYQISQYANPIITGGHVHITVDGQKHCIGIIRAHLEEDAGKAIHPAGADYSLVDFNRVGTPLLEIVSAPDIHSPAVAKAFVRELYLLMKYADVTEGDLYHGNMRFDVNISVSKSKQQPGTRTEVKNLNSFRSVEAAVAYEVKRQTELLKKGKPIIQETLGWDESKQKTISQRGKEEAHDYRYFPEPDVPPVELDGTYVDKIAAALPDLPPMIRTRLAALKIGNKVIEDILDRPDIVPLILRVLERGSADDARRVAFWLIQELPAGQTANLKFKLEIGDLIKLSRMAGSGELNSTAAKKVLAKMIKSGQDPTQLTADMDLLQISDEAQIEELVEKVLEANPNAVADIKKGEIKAIGFLVGQVMKASQAKADPALATRVIKKKLGV